MRPALRIASAVVLALASWSGVARSDVLFQGLGDLPGGAFYTRTWGMSANGLVPVGGVSSATGSHAFRWQAGVFEELIAPFAWTDAEAASADGGVVVGQSWRWDHGVVTRVRDQDGNPVLQTTDVSADGSVMVGHGNGGFRWENGVTVQIPSPPGYETYMENLNVSADGSVIAGDVFWQSWEFNRRAFRRAGGVLTVLPPLTPDDYETSAWGVSADGQVVVGFADAVPVYWKDGSIFALPSISPPVTAGNAYDASGDGSVIVGKMYDLDVPYDPYDPFSSPYSATLWFGGGAHRVADLLEGAGIDLGGWRLHEAWAVSDDGLVIAGNGSNPDGFAEAWIAYFDRCANGLDDDGDGATDFPSDPGCASATAVRENPSCDDDLDNDGDGKIDWDGGSGGATPDAQCVGHPSRNREIPAGGCGLGADLVLAFAALALARRRLA